MNSQGVAVNCLEFFPRKFILLGLIRSGGSGHVGLGGQTSTRQWLGSDYPKQLTFVVFCVLLH